jgi:hypothetical protein
MKALFAGTMALLALCTVSARACTEEELLAKVVAVTAKIQDMAESDPQRLGEWSQAFAARQQAAPPTSVDDVCRLYDDMLAGLN